MNTPARKGRLTLEDGTVFEGSFVGRAGNIAGEVVFNTGMVGYTEALTDPSYKGQILVLTYPLIGNYGIPHADGDVCASASFESPRVQISGLIVADAAAEYSHWNAGRSLAQWLDDEGVPALSGIDSRSLTKRLRRHGSMLGKIVIDSEDTPFDDPNQRNLVSLVSVLEPIVYQRGPARVVLVDCGCKAGIIRSLLARDVTVIRVPWDYDFTDLEVDGVVVSNGPGDPQICRPTVDHLKKVLLQNRPVFGICLGHQLLALASGARTYKLKFGHRGQNQPCLLEGTRRCYITSQNHGYAVDTTTLPGDWKPWFTNANDGTNEGLRHTTRPFMSVQFHPEAAPGPLDTNHLFDHFLGLLQ